MLHYISTWLITGYTHITFNFHSDVVHNIALSLWYCRYVPLKLTAGKIILHVSILSTNDW